MDPFTIAAMAAQAGYGLYRGIKAQKGLRALQKQRMPSYMEAMAPYRENYDLYRQQYVGGMGPGSLNLAQQQFATQQAGLLRAPVSGQLRDQLGRVAAASTGMFAQNLAAQNEAIRRGAISGMTAANQSIAALQQRDVGTRLDQRLRQEQAYGQAMQQGFQDVLGAAGGLATAKMAEKQMDLYRDIYGVGKRVRTTADNVFNPNAPVLNFASGPAMPERTIQPNLNGPVTIVGGASTPSSFSTGSAMPEGIAPNLNGPVTILPTPSYETFMGGPFNPYRSYGGFEGYDLGIPPLRTKYSTPKIRFK